MEQNGYPWLTGYRQPIKVGSEPGNKKHSGEFQKTVKLPQVRILSSLITS
jgi:hypothetical protein